MMKAWDGGKDKVNIKTLQREAKRQGYTILREYDPEFKEMTYTVIDATGREIAQSNNEDYLKKYLLELVGTAGKPQPRSIMH